MSATVFVSEVAGADAMARSEARCDTIRTGTRAKYIADSSHVLILNPIFFLWILLCSWNPLLSIVVVLSL